MTGQRRLRQLKRLVETPAGDQRDRQFAALPVGARMAVAVAPDRPRQPVLAGRYRAEDGVLPAQRRFQGIIVDDPQLDQGLTDPPAAAFLAGQRNLDVVRGRKSLRDQKFAEKHGGFSRCGSALSGDYNNEGNRLIIPKRG